MSVEWVEPRVGERNLLLLSDVHLGADLRRRMVKRSGLAALLANDALDRELGGLLDHYAGQVADGGWRLVLAGDVIDFIAINVTPEDLGEPSPFEPTSEEREDGLEPGPERCAWMLGLVARRHPLFFERLGAFVAAGHELVVVRGNHDAAFFWPEVQDAFRTALVDGAQRAGCELSRGAADAVRFEDWFYYEPGRIYVEHGHLHDEACAEPGGRPVEAARPNRLAQPVSTLALRYFANRFPTLDLDSVDTWGPGDFVRWAFVVENPLVVTAAFARTMAMLLLPPLRRVLRERRRDRAADGEADELVTRAQARLGAVERVEVRARELAGRVRATAQFGVSGVLRMFCLDRLAAAGTGVVLGAGVLAIEAPGVVRAGLAVAVLAGCLVADRHLGAARQVAIGPKLRSAADALAPHLDVPLVVMGHSHKAVDTVLGDRSTRYVNLGSWLPAMRGATSTAGLPHLVLRGAEASFLRWRGAPVAQASGATG